ncbi:MAG: hypothetical protein PHS62_04695 [Patescibacteria group bacterium]|nr:hypothetical protein [Patescibacteria group bacterium]
MNTKVSPLTRQELQKLLVTDADAFTALRFLRHRERTPALADLENQGGNEVPGFAGALCDLYHTLWAETPMVKEEIPADRRFFAEILRGAMASSSFESLHAQTQYSDIKSVLGTLSMGDAVLATVSEEEKKNLQDTAEAQKAADTAEAEAGQAEAEANAAEMLAQSTAEQAAGGNSTGAASGLTPEEAQAIANELAEQAQEARVKTDSARETANGAKEFADSVANQLLGQPGSEEALEKAKELSRRGLAAAQKTHTAVEEVSKTIDSWGLEEGELVQMGIPEAMTLLEKMRQSDALKKFAQLLGRIKRIAARKAASDDKAEGIRVAKPETGRDIKRALPRELIALAHPALRVQALKRWTRGELALRGEEQKRKLGEGPVVVCEDSSGSMDGVKQQWAKAIVLSLAHYAKLRNRSFAWIMFDSAVKRSKIYQCGRLSPKDLLEIAESRSGGGTDFEIPLREAVKVICTAGLKKADIAFITDGDCAVSDEFVREFGEVKKALEVNVFAVLCDVGHTAEATIAKFSDRIERASSFNEVEAEQVFQKL